MSVFGWICIGFGIVCGLLQGWSNNQNRLNLEQKNGNEVIRKGFNSKATGIILMIIVVIFAVITIKAFSNLGTDNVFSGNKEYEDIAQNYIEDMSKEYMSYMTLVNTTSYSLDREVRVTLEYRFTEGPNISYLTYVIAIDKETKEVVGLSQR